MGEAGDKVTSWQELSDADSEDVRDVTDDVTDDLHPGDPTGVASGLDEDHGAAA
jgi:hypothetical protein